MHSFMMGTIQIGCWLLWGIEMLVAAQCSIAPVSVGPQILLLWHWWLMVVNFLHKRIGINYSMDLLPSIWWIMSRQQSLNSNFVLPNRWEMRDLYQAVCRQWRQKMAKISQLLCVGTEARKRQGRVVFSKNLFLSSGQLTAACLRLRCSAPQSGWHGDRVVFKWEVQWH